MGSFPRQKASVEVKISCNLCSIGEATRSTYYRSDKENEAATFQLHALTRYCKFDVDFTKYLDQLKTNVDYLSPI